MIIPNAEQIEIARDRLLKASGSMLLKQAKELHAATDYGMFSDTSCGFQLGLETARVVIGQSVAIAKAGIKPEDVL